MFSGYLENLPVSSLTNAFLLCEEPHSSVRTGLFLALCDVTGVLKEITCSFYCTEHNCLDSKPEMLCRNIWREMVPFSWNLQPNSNQITSSIFIGFYACIFIWRICIYFIINTASILHLKEKTVNVSMAVMLSLLFCFLQNFSIHFSSSPSLICALRYSLHLPI